MLYFRGLGPPRPRKEWTQTNENPKASILELALNDTR